MLNDQSVIPQSPEAEQAVVGSLMVAPEMLPEVAQIIREVDFLDASLATIFSTITKLSAEGKPVDKVAVVEFLRDRKMLAEVGGVERISGLLNTVPTTDSVGYYAHIVREKSDIRALIRLGRDVSVAAIDGGTPAHVLKIAQDGLDAIRERQGYTEVMSLIEAAEEYFRLAPDLEKMGMALGISPQLDRLTGGLHPGQLVIVAARTGMGKSVVCEQIAVNIARSQNEKGDKPSVLYIPTEMGRVATTKRILGRLGMTPKAELLFQNHAAQDEIWPVLAEHNFDIIDNARPISVESIWALCAARKPNLVVIDHARHIKGWLEKDGKNSRSDASATNITLELTRLASALNCSVLLAHQINREGGKRTRPALTDLRDTGALEDAAWKVICLHRPFRDDPDEDKVMEFSVLKNRGGPEGRTFATWDGPRVSIHPMSDAEATDARRRVGEAKNDNDND